MTRVAIAIAIAAAASTAAADPEKPSFEARAASAQRVHRIENVVWALTATCDAGDDVQQRQCRHVRDARAAELAGQTLLVDGDPEAFEVGAWSAAKKSIPFTVGACIRCLGVEVDGNTWRIVGLGAPVHVDKGKLLAGPLASDARTFANEAAAQAWARAVGNARVELVVKVPTHPRLAQPGNDIVALDIVAWRAYAPCDGAIIAASPPSAPVDADKKQCIRPPADRPTPELGDLSPDVIRTAMQPVVDAARVCFGKLAVTGTAKLSLRVLRDGTIGHYEQTGDFVHTPMGACIDKAVAKLAFPATAEGMTINFPITAQP